MAERRIYSSDREGLTPAQLALPVVSELVAAILGHFAEEEGYFQEAFGIDCADGYVPGAAAEDDPAGHVADRLHRPSAYPLGADHATWDEEALFATVELAMEMASAPVEAEEHQGCGWHGTRFSGPMGKDRLREEFDAVLIDYGPGYQVDETGKVIALARRAGSPAGR